MTVPRSPQLETSSRSSRKSTSSSPRALNKERKSCLEREEEEEDARAEEEKKMKIKSKAHKSGKLKVALNLVGRMRRVEIPLSPPPDLNRVAREICRREKLDLSSVTSISSQIEGAFKRETQQIVKVRVRGKGGVKRTFEIDLCQNLEQQINQIGIEMEFNEKEKRRLIRAITSKVEK